jgi:ABC-type Fe3+-siderophore transport system permease subunit
VVEFIAKMRETGWHDNLLLVSSFNHRELSLVRRLGGTDHRILLPTAVLFGGSLLVLADSAARTLISPLQLPVGVLTALIGVPVFLVLLHRQVAR